MSANIVKCLVIPIAVSKQKCLGMITYIPVVNIQHYEIIIYIVSYARVCQEYLKNLIIHTTNIVAWFSEAGGV